MVNYSYDRRQASTRFELVYSSGGTGGPYRSEDEAKEAAERLLKGGSDRWIAVVDAKDVNNLTRAKALWLLKRGGDWEKGPRPLPNVRPMDHFKEAAKPDPEDEDPEWLERLGNTSDVRKSADAASASSASDPGSVESVLAKHGKTLVRAIRSEFPKAKVSWKIEKKYGGAPEREYLGLTAFADKAPGWRGPAKFAQITPGGVYRNGDWLMEIGGSIRGYKELSASDIKKLVSTSFRTDRSYWVKFFGSTVTIDPALIKEIQDYVYQASGLKPDEASDTKLEFSTRENGDVYDERPGKADVVMMRDLKKGIEAKFSGALVSIEIVDEWVHLTVELK